MSQHALYRRSKMGHLPGDLHKSDKIAMLEGDVPFEVFPWQTVGAACAKFYRRDHHRKANRRFRHQGKWELRGQI